MSRIDLCGSYLYYDDLDYLILFPDKNFKAMCGGGQKMDYQVRGTYETENSDQIVKTLVLQVPKSFFGVFPGKSKEEFRYQFVIEEGIFVEEGGRGWNCWDPLEEQVNIFRKKWVFQGDPPRFLFQREPYISGSYTPRVCYFAQRPYQTMTRKEWLEKKTGNRLNSPFVWVFNNQEKDIRGNRIVPNPRLDTYIKVPEAIEAFNSEETYHLVVLYDIWGKPAAYLMGKLTNEKDTGMGTFLVNYSLYNQASLVFIKKELWHIKKWVLDQACHHQENRYVPRKAIFCRDNDYYERLFKGVQPEVGGSDTPQINNQFVRVININDPIEFPLLK